MKVKYQQINSLWQHLNLRYTKGHILNSLYNQTFETVLANTDELRKETFRLRYQVFCIENRFIDPNKHPDNMEYDEFDNHSKHILLRYRPTGEFVGSIRVILPNKNRLDRTFPVQSSGVEHPIARNTNAMSNHCEFSRLLILKSFKDRIHKDKNYQNIYEEKSKGNWVQRKFIPYAPIGLFRAACEVAIDNGIENCFSIMEPKHLRALYRLGINKIQLLGKPVEYHGIRQPFTLNLLENYENGFLNAPDTWVIMADGGRIHSKLINTARTQQETHGERYLRHALC